MSCWRCRAWDPCAASGHCREADACAPSGHRRASDACRASDSCRVSCPSLVALPVKRASPRLNRAMVFNDIDAGGFRRCRWGFGPLAPQKVLSRATNQAACFDVQQALHADVRAARRTNWASTTALTPTRRRARCQEFGARRPCTLRPWPMTRGNTRPICPGVRPTRAAGLAAQRAGPHLGWPRHGG